MRWINATHLTQWADTRTSEGQLPLLIRKLILASDVKWPEIGIPAGDSIFKPGWDGLCQSHEKIKLVPEGTSCWEWGRNNDYRKKLNEDFSKRTLATPAKDQAQATFVFVTPRRWSGVPKSEVISALKNGSSWKNILIYDADDLELWLEHCPAVGRWLALELKVITDDVVSAEEFWETYTRQPDFQFTPDFIIAGRSAAASWVTVFLSEDAGAGELQASSKEEGTAFVISAMLAANQEKDISVFSNTLLVSDQQVLKKLNETQSGLTIIFTPDNDAAVSLMGKFRNHVIAVVSYRVKVKNQDVALPLPDSGKFSQGLIDMGVPYREAYNLTKICGKSHNVLRRILTDQAGRVSWSLNYPVSELIPLFFVQKFDDEKFGDQEALATLSGLDYPAYKAVLKKWTLIPDPPITQLTNHWQVVSAYDLLYIVGRHITEEDLERFETVFLHTMSGHDPALELEPHLRMAAKMFDKESPYSKRLKDGLCQVLALISIYGKDSGINVSTSLSLWADRIVKRLLDDQQLRFWQSVEKNLHLLAEAAPDAFLQKMESLTQTNPEIISELFNDQHAGLFNPTYHTHILWALEILAWDPAYLPRVVLLLSRLLQLDQGKAYANRPVNTLTNIMRWWYPQTFATLEERKNVVELLIKRNPEAAFTLLLTLAPHISDIASDTHKPIWRMRERYIVNVTQAEYFEGLSFNCDKLLQQAGNDPDKWVKVAELADNHQGELRERIVSHMLTINFDADKSDELRERLRSLLRSHARAGKKESDWKLSKEHRTALRQVLDRLYRTATDRYLGFFNVEAIETRATGDDWEKQRKLTASKRVEVIKIILKEDGLESVFEMVPKIKYHFWLGHTLAQVHPVALPEVVSKITDGEVFEKMVIGYLSGFIEMQGLSWLEKQIIHFEGILPEDKLVVFYLATEAGPDLWSLIQRVSPQLYDRYWTTIYTEMYHPWVAKENKELCIRQLNRYKRFATSLNEIYDESLLTTETIIETLTGYTTDNNEPDRSLRSGEYKIRKLYKRLLDSNADPDSMHMLEWYYYQVLKKEHHEKSLITYLYRNLNTHPDFFAQLVQFLYIPEEGDPESEIKGMSHENIEGRAHNADEVLTGWNVLPGTDENGNCNFSYLAEYMKNAITHCKALKRPKHSMRELGKLLGRSDVPGTAWPHPEICELIEQYNDKDLNEGFYHGYYNRNAGEVRIRPARSSHDYGEAVEGNYLQELARKIGSKFPVTARVIADIAASKLHWVEYMKKRDAQGDE